MKRAILLRPWCNAHLVQLLRILAILLVMCDIPYVLCQCLNAGSPSCLWSHENSTQLRWAYKTGAGENFIELTKCKRPSCGTASLASPWFPVSPAPLKFTLEYKIYGTSSVYLKAYLKLQDDSQSTPLLEKYGNYGQGFPTGWTADQITVPATNIAYRILIKGNTPYAEAYIAVMGIRINDAIPSRTTKRPSPVEQEPEPVDQTKDEDNELTNGGGNNNNNQGGTDPQIPIPNVEDPENYNDLELTQALEQGRYSMDENDFTFGRTTVVYPNLCKYR